MNPNAATPLSTIRRTPLRSALVVGAAMTALLVGALIPTRVLAQSGGAACGNPFWHYNIGLLYFELGKHERAVQQSHKAIALGMTRPELTDMLKREGKSREPTP
jgi:hypothetical protein